MGYEFSCHRCGSQIRISEPKPDTKYRCPKCRAKVRYRAKPLDPFVSSETLAAGYSSRTLKLALAALLIAVLGAGGIGYYGYRSNKIATDEFERLQRLSIDQIAEARRQAKSFSFDKIGAILSAAESEVVRSSPLNPHNKEMLLDRLSSARGELTFAEREYARKTKEGYGVVDGQLVSPDKLAQAIAEKQRQEEAEQAMREAQAQARAEAEEKGQAIREAEEQAAEERRRRQQEKDESQHELKEALRALPPVQDVLDGFEYSMQRTKMTSALLSRRLADIDPGKPFDLREFTIAKDDLMRFLREPDTGKTALVAVFRDDIMDYLVKLDFNAFLRGGNATTPDGMPIQLASFDGRPALLLGTVYTDAIFDSSALGTTTAENRAAAFIRRTALPALIRSHTRESMKSPGLDFLGIVFGYASRNHSKENDVPEAEILCLVMPTKDLAALGRQNLSPEDLVKKSAVFLAVKGEKFTRVEILLD